MTPTQQPGRERLIREERGRLLAILNSVYPSARAEEDLIDDLVELQASGDDDYIRRDLGYLSQLGLIAGEMQPRLDTGRRRRYWRLTAKGELFVRRGLPWDKIEVLEP